MQKRWHSFSGRVERTVGQDVVTVTNFQVYDRENPNDVYYTAQTQQEAVDWVLANFRLLPVGRFRTRAVTETNVVSVKKAQFLVPLTPVGEFEFQTTLLTTRGYWDVFLTTTGGPPLQAINFAFAIHVLPLGLLFNRLDNEQQGVGIQNLVLKDSPPIPDVLFDDVGWFVYESFVRITGSALAHDPPFHSKSKRVIPAGSVLVPVIGVDFGVDIAEATIAFGCRFRCLTQN